MELMETFNTLMWEELFPVHVQNRAVTALEGGKLLYFPKLAFELTADEQRFLSPDWVAGAAKNISYNPMNGEVRGVQGTPKERQDIKSMMARFAEQARILINGILPHYQTALEQARTSFRPVEILNRKTSDRKDDKRLHVDAFPANPNQGRRILRVFANINPHGMDRVWRIGEPFEEVAKRFLPEIGKPRLGVNRLLKMLGITKSLRTEYDHIMLQMHDRMKLNEIYQKLVPQTEVWFPPGSSWIVQTDRTSHAALSGQHVLEQTFYLPVQAMVNPDRSPLKILERLKGYALVR